MLHGNYPVTSMYLCMLRMYCNVYTIITATVSTKFENLLFVKNFEKLSIVSVRILSSAAVAYVARIGSPTGSWNERRCSMYGSGSSSYPWDRPRTNH